MHNPYLDEYNALSDDFITKHMARYKLLEKYSYAVPSQQAIEYISSLSPIVEIGAGTGYWAYLLRQLGTDIIAYDESPYKNGYVNHQWSEVLEGTPITLKQHTDRTLFICWPPFDTSFASDCLKNYKGNDLIYIGEGSGGCTGDEQFFELLDAEWDGVDNDVNIPKYEGLHDYLYYFRRKLDFTYYKEW